MSAHGVTPDIGLDYLLERTQKVKGCWLWTLRVHFDRPVATIGRVQFQMRRVVWSLVHECDLLPGYHAVPACGNAHCLHPNHLEERRRNEEHLGAHRSTLTRHRMSTARLAHTTLSMQDVEEIKTGRGLMKHVAAVYGVSPSHAYRIRQGTARRDYLDPFSQIVKGL